MKIEIENKTKGYVFIKNIYGDGTVDYGSRPDFPEEKIEALFDRAEERFMEALHFVKEHCEFMGSEVDPSEIGKIFREPLK